MRFIVRVGSIAAICSRSLFLAIIIATFGAVPAKALQADTTSQSIGVALVEEGLVGATWALVTPEGTTLGAAGLKDVSRNLPLVPDDRMQIGSVAKTILATGVLRLVTEGRVELDAPLAKYLPDVPIENPWAPAAPLRVRHLLDHTGGLDDARMWQVFSLRAEPDAPLSDGLTHPGDTLRLRHSPGDRFSYSNTGYLLLGMLIEAVTKTRYEHWLDAELLAPLGMHSSTATFVTQSGPRADDRLAMGHFDPQTTSSTVPIFVRPATQFTTTAADMARFARFLMSDGVVDGRVFVEGTLLRAMAVPTTTEAARAGLGAGYALGLLRRDRHGAVGHCHLGNSGTFRSALCLYPAQQSAYFVAFNTDPEQGNFDRVDALLVETLGLRLSEAELAEGSVQVPGVDPSEWNGLYRQRPNRFEQFAYLDELAGITRVSWDGQALTLRPLQGTTRSLTPVGGALFRAPDRREASHVLLRTADGVPVVADGVRSLERVSLWSVTGIWASAAAGLLALLYLLTFGMARCALALRRGGWRKEPLLLPALCLALLVMAPALYLTQSFLAIGDPTPANLVIAMLTGVLPLTLLAAAWQRVRTGLGSFTARLDILAIAGLLQWCAVLAAWGLMPFVLWR
jgi:CubicO group peptidase (beta-lactamase class C family)